VKIHAGVHQPDSGRILLGGRRVEIAGPAEARALGIAVVHQEPRLFPDLTVAENVYIGHAPAGRLGSIDWGATRRAAGTLFAKLDVQFDVNAPVRGLSMADQQLIEIAKSLSVEARVLILDEPTASLSAHEVERLFVIVHRLRERGVAILFVSHRLDAGEIRLGGTNVEFTSPSAAMIAGIAYVPEDRHQDGLVLDFTIAQNVTLPILPRLFPRLLVRAATERAVAAEQTREFQVRMTGVDQLVGALSGGNQQKVVLAKWLASKPRVLILDEPTRGIDIGAKVEVHRIISELAASGLGIVLISSDLPEVLAM